MVNNVVSSKSTHFHNWGIFSECLGNHYGFSPIQFWSLQDQGYFLAHQIVYIQDLMYYKKVLGECSLSFNPNNIDHKYSRINHGMLL